MNTINPNRMILVVSQRNYEIRRDQFRNPAGKYDFLLFWKSEGDGDDVDTPLWRRIFNKEIGSYQMSLSQAKTLLEKEIKP